MVREQIAAGIDIVNDGEMSKPSYATYIKDRLDGFGGTGNTFVYQDLAEFPKLHAARVRRSRPLAPQDAGCNAPDQRARRRGRARRHRQPEGGGRAARRAAARRFMSAASPGVVVAVLPQRLLQDHEDYLYAIADAMRHEYETVAKAGIVLQIDCPDLGMGRHVQFADLTLEEFRKKRAAARRGAQPRARATSRPEQLRMHLCWGNYEGPHHCDVPLADIIDVVFLAQAAAPSRSRPPTRATRTSGRCSRR